MVTAPRERLTPLALGLLALRGRAGTVGHISSPTTGAGELQERSVRIRHRRVPASSTLEEGTAPGVAPPPPNPPGFPLPSSPARSSSEERKGAAAERCPGEQGGHHLPRGRPSPAAPAALPRPAPLGWKRSRTMNFRASRGEGAQKGFPQLPHPAGFPSAPGAVLTDHCLPWSGMFNNGVKRPRKVRQNK